jgi:3-dehydroshikimate dehydratase
MLRPGLVSISFRQLSPEEIVRHCVEARLEGIEWGGDVHVPHGDVLKAREVRRMTEDAGLEVSAYGSYYRLAASEGQGLSFEPVLASAVELGAGLIRVWPGVKGSAQATDEERRAVIDDARRIAALAASAGRQIAFEYHGGTLTDTNESAQALLAALPEESVTTLWQPPNGRDADYCLEGLEAILPRVSGVHVFHWGPEGFKDKRPLAEGKDRWSRYLQALRRDGRERWACLEFMPENDNPALLAREAATLRGLLGS